ncbi:MAG: protein kinase, partial [Planctomycetaceae bacterium]
MAPDSAPPSDSNPGQQSHKTDLPESFGRFRILKLLGQGGMGLVYLADDPKKDRQVALKVLAQEKADNQTLLKRFRSEALATRELKHPNIVGVYEAGSIDGQFYIALEFVEGTDVARLIQSRGRLPVRRSLDVTRQVATALSVAHQRNIVHRDIKPSNLLIRRDGVVKLTDTGLARSLDDSGEAGITRAGTTVGTVDYISPEQARDSKAADTRSDIYSLGCTWYHMLTGQAPFPDGNLIQKLRHHATTTAPDPRIINDTTPEDVVVVLQRMLLKDPDARFQDPDQLIAALDAIDLDRRELTDNVLAALAEDDSEPASAPPTRPRRARPAPRSDELDTRKTTETLDAVPNRTATTDGSTKPAKPAEPATPVEPATPADPTPAVDESADPTDSNTPSNPTAHKPATRHTQSRDRKPSPSSSRKPAAPPPSPRSRRAARTVETPEDEHDRIGWERLKPVALVILGGCALGLIVYIFANLGQSVDMSDTQGGGNPFDRSAQRNGPAAGDDRTDQNGGGPNDNSADFVAYDTIPATTLTGTPSHPPSRPTQLRQGEQRHRFEWVRTSADTALPLLQVVSGQLGPGQFYSLDAALASLGTPGGWIQLHGPGPFFITATTLNDLGHVVITASRRGRAVVVLRPRPDSDNTISILNLNKTSLDLRRLDIVPAARAFPGKRPLTLIASHDSDVRLRGCTITQPEHRDGGTTSLAVTGASENRPTRILLDNVLVRGRSTSLLELDSRNADVALVNCLLVTDAVSPIHVLTPGGAGDETDRRHVRLLSSTLCSDEPLLTLDCGAAGPGMPSTHVRLVNSLMVCPETGTRVLLDLGRWPQHNGNSNSQSRFLKL